MEEPTLKEMTESFVLTYDYEQLVEENEWLYAQQERLIEENNNLRSHRDQIMNTMTKAAGDVLAERRRQVETEGWTPDHDDKHNNGEMPCAAGLYAISAGFATKYLDGETETCPVPDGWPWAPECWKPANARRDLVKAGALILAEIERIDRAAQPGPPAAE